MTKIRALNWWKPAVCGVSMLLYATALSSAPKAESEQECFLVSDMALTARALTIEGIEEGIASKILTRMYKGPGSPQWIPVVLQSARADKREAGDYARALYSHCTSNRGNLDAFFGVGA